MFFSLKMFQNNNFKKKILARGAASWLVVLEFPLFMLATVPM